MDTLKSQLEWSLKINSISLDRIRCALVKINEIPIQDITTDEVDEINFNLSEDYSPRDLEQFLARLDVEYDVFNYYANIQAIIWLDNGSWLEYEIDFDYGSSYWKFNPIPEIPRILRCR